MSNKPVPTHRFNSILALMKAARKYMTHLSGLSKRKSLDRYCDEMDGGMRDLVAHPAVFLFGVGGGGGGARYRSEEHTSALQSRGHLVCRLLPGRKKDPSVVPS